MEKIKCWVHVAGTVLPIDNYVMYRFIEDIQNNSPIHLCINDYESVSLDTSGVYAIVSRQYSDNNQLFASVDYFLSKSNYELYKDLGILPEII